MGWTDRGTLALLALLSWILAAPSPAHAADPAPGDEDSFEVQDLSPAQQETRTRRREELLRPASRIELGGYWNQLNDFKFGDFTGLTRRGLDVLGNFDLRRAAVGEPTSEIEPAWYWRARGQNLGLRSHSNSIELGRQGSFGFSLQYDGLPHYESNSVRDPYAGSRGSTSRTLPAGWVSGSNAAALTQLGARLRAQDVQHDRENLRGRFGLVLPFGWQFDARYHRERKEGDKLTGAVLGNSGGNPRAFLLPEALDHETDLWDTTLEWAGERARASFGYHGSFFDNRKPSLTWQSAWSGVGGWNAAAFFPGGLARKSSAPDNSAHQLTFAGAVELPLRTRLAVDSALGWMFQDASFLPYTANPALAATITTPLPRGHLDGKLFTRNVNLRLDSRLGERLRLAQSLRFDDRDNRTPRDLYIYIGGDSTVQDDATSLRARLNRPYDYRMLEYRADASYALWHRTQLSAGYGLGQVDRNFQETDVNHERTFRLGLQGQPLQTVGLRLGWERSDRDSPHYDNAASFLAGSSAAHIATLALDERFENHPLLRRAHLAAREHDRATAAFTWTPSEPVSLIVQIDRADDDYPHSPLGIQEARSLTSAADLSWQLMAHLGARAHYSVERQRTGQRGHSIRGGASLLTDIADPTRRWSSRERTSVQTLGGGFDLSLLEERLSFSADYVCSRAVGVDRVQRLLPAPDFPETHSYLHSITASLRYRLPLHRDVSLRLSYSFERLDVDDWSLDLLGPATITNVITTGRDTPTYRSQLWALSVIYQFR